ncbi:MAG: hypothetical protein M0R22_05945 [Dehalococcoidia bacterium]|nr:hypothetical protein [Dehalococcoidia bacterium]
MKRLVLMLALCLLLSGSLLPCVAFADDQGQGDALEGLTDEEKGYVERIAVANLQARSAVATVLLVEVALSSPTSSDSASLTDLIDAVVSCQTELKTVAGVFRETAPESMQGVGTMCADMATRLDGAFSSCLPMLRNEVSEQRLLDDLRESLSGFMYVPEEAVQGQRAVELARAVSCTRLEAKHLTNQLLALDGKVGDAARGIAETQRALEDFIQGLLLDNCFIATAAYGTSTAAEIDVLRDFRDEVLLMSPAGCDLVAFYYAASPPIADFIARHELLRTVVREGVVDPVVRVVSLAEPLWQTA